MEGKVMTTDLSRRAILAGASAMPIIALAGAPGAASGTAADRRLFEIESKAARIGAQVKIAGRIHDEAEEAILAWGRRNPEPRRLSLDDAELRDVIEKHGTMLVAGMLRGCGRRFSSAPDLEDIVIRREAAINQWRRRRDRAVANCGEDRKEAAFGKLIDRVDTLLDEVAGIRATTIAGLQCKARLVEAHDKMNDPDNTLVSSILKDLLALSAEA
jgi:hypothetical protein